MKQHYVIFARKNLFLISHKDTRLSRESSISHSNSFSFNNRRKVQLVIILRLHAGTNTRVVESLKNGIVTSLSSSVIKSRKIRRAFVNRVDPCSLLGHKIPPIGTIALFVPSEFKRRDTKTADLIDRRRGTLMNCRIDRPK